MMQELLELLEKNSRLTTAELAVMLGKTEDEIRQAVGQYEKEKIILSYNTMIDWDKTDRESITALIEVKVIPQRGFGFDKVAERIYQYSDVKACYLMSGGFDLTVIIEGKTMKEVAYFVAEKLAPMEYVQSTATHFVLKKYKDNGVIFEEKSSDDREPVVL